MFPNLFYQQDFRARTSSAKHTEDFLPQIELSPLSLRHRHDSSKKIFSLPEKGLLISLIEIAFDKAGP